MRTSDCEKADSEAAYRVYRFLVIDRFLHGAWRDLMVNARALTNSFPEVTLPQAIVSSCEHILRSTSSTRPALKIDLDNSHYGH